MEYLLHGRIMGLPVWLVGVAIAGAGLGVYILIKRRGGASSTSGGGVLGQNTSTQADPNIDPNTGIPYAVEEATDPNTGLPVYMTLLNQGSGLTGSGQTTGGAVPPPGPVGQPQPAPGPSGPAGQPQPVATNVSTGATSGAPFTVNINGAGPSGQPQPGVPPSTGPKGPPGPGFAQASGTPLQQGGKFRGTSVPTAYAFQATSWWPYDFLAEPWNPKHPWPSGRGE